MSERKKWSWIKEPDREPPKSPLPDMARNSGAGTGDAHSKEDEPALQNANMRLYTERSPHYFGKQEKHRQDFPLGEPIHGKEKKE